MLKRMAESNLPTKYKEWAKTMLKENKTEAIYRYGANGMFLLGHMPAGAVASIITSPTLMSGGKRLLKKAADYTKSAL
jgi:hypothetical protein